ncbi:glutamyl-tRNA reductase [Schumannella soli]|uniref:Glutamyl-tRNA reductase n=1 Tax=Schumannella soli TaxID=2590779 RepID=A0A506Y7V6_9MICO|nr:glutamyl-tRNA reductase [Schumannella soli]TPW77963.1 glutamyl-tRNA reductase [Schumannella soli]
MLVCLTANHRNAGFDLLDRLSVGAPGAVTELISAEAGIQGAVVVATCNRFEAYLDVDGVDADAAVERTVAVMSRAGGVSGAELLEAADVKTADDVTRHLFAVASGLESVVVGEDEIAGQVRRSYDQARTEQTSTSALDRLFQRAAATSRAVRGATDLGGAGRSIARLALELATSRVTDWSRARVLVVGTGSYAATTIAALHDRGAVDISVYSATGRAQMFATKYGVRAVSELREGIAAADVVITCTARYAVAPADVTDENRRLVIDLGLPRNVDPAVGRLPGVELLDLEIIALHAPLPEMGLSETARDLVGSAASAFAAEQTAAPAIVALRQHVFDALDEEIARAESRGHGDPAGTAKTVEALRHLAGVLLHTPSVRARELTAEGRGAEFAAGLEALFGVSVEDAASAAPVSPLRRASADEVADAAAASGHAAGMPDDEFHRNLRRNA